MKHATAKEAIVDHRDGFFLLCFAKKQKAFRFPPLPFIDLRAAPARRDIIACRDILSKKRRGEREEKRSARLSEKKKGRE